MSAETKDGAPGAGDGADVARVRFFHGATDVSAGLRDSLSLGRRRRLVVRTQRDGGPAFRRVVPAQHRSRIADPADRELLPDDHGDDGGRPVEPLGRTREGSSQIRLLRSLNAVAHALLDVVPSPGGRRRNVVQHSLAAVLRRPRPGVAVEDGKVRLQRVVLDAAVHHVDVLHVLAPALLRRHRKRRDDRSLLLAASSLLRRRRRRRAVLLLRRRRRRIPPSFRRHLEQRARRRLRRSHVAVVALIPQRHLAALFVPLLRRRVFRPRTLLRRSSRGRGSSRGSVFFLRRGDDDGFSGRLGGFGRLGGSFGRDDGRLGGGLLGVDLVELVVRRRTP
mmetsp:Transcript_24415/g.75384  ORF Transcript_24415/g.75384 Transcript_24415/m.75384 type:complete len:335 (-) Transcript_24415:213-1217(-)